MYCIVCRAVTVSGFSLHCYCGQKDSQYQYIAISLEILNWSNRNEKEIIIFKCYIQGYVDWRCIINVHYPYENINFIQNNTFLANTAIHPIN